MSVVCPVETCRQPMWLDSQFEEDAKLERITVSRFYDLAGHTLYVGPAVDERGWTARDANSPLPCAKCGGSIAGTHGDRKFKRGRRGQHYLCEQCRVRK